MKKILTPLFVVCLFFAFYLQTAKAESLSAKFSGKILLQVESRGEAWYVHPTQLKRYYMANGNEAYNIMRKFGVGITNNDLNKIKNNKVSAKKYSGKIFLQVEDKGQAYYVNSDGTIYYLKDGNEAYNIMKKLGVGILNKNLEQIEVGTSGKVLPQEKTTENEKTVISKGRYDEINLKTISYVAVVVTEKKYINGSFGGTVADENKKFVVIDMKVTNITNSEYDFGFDYENAFTIIDTDGNQYKPWGPIIGKIDHYLSMRKLAPGVPAYGKIVYELPENTSEYYLIACKADVNECYGTKLAP